MADTVTTTLPDRIGPQGYTRQLVADRKYVLGVDIGGTGSVAVLNQFGEPIEAFDMPATVEANGRRATNAPLLASLLARSHARIVFAEFVAARPSDGSVQAFSFGRARGILEGCCGALGIPIVWIAPTVWKRLADVPPGKENKDLARTRAIAKWPANADFFARKRDLAKAEACLIALAGLKREARR
jgi:crossover junction endodeoxyribonuclease RuvC